MLAPRLQRQRLLPRHPSADADRGSRPLGAASRGTVPIVVGTRPPPAAQLQVVLARQALGSIPGTLDTLPHLALDRLVPTFWG